MLLSCIKKWNLLLPLFLYSFLLKYLLIFHFIFAKYKNLRTTNLMLLLFENVTGGVSFQVFKILLMLCQIYLNKFSVCTVMFFIFLLFYIYMRRKYWIRENFWHPVFDRFTCFEMSWTWFHYYSKCLLVCLSVTLSKCDTNFLAALRRKLIDGIAWNFMFSDIFS